MGRAPAGSDGDTRDFRLRILNYIAFLAFSALVTAAAIVDQEYNYDMVPYTALVVGGETPDQRHARTWETVRPYLPPERERDFAEATTGLDVVHRAGDLGSLLPYHAIKVGYIFVIRVFSQFFDPVRAMQAISLVAALASSLFLFLGFRRIGGVLALGWLPVVALLDIDRLARICTPDALALALGAAALLLLERRRYPAATALLLAMNLVRPDLLVLNAMIALALMRQVPRFGAALFFGAAATYVGATQLGGYPGWWPHFYMTFLAHGPAFDMPAPPFDAGLALKALAVAWGKVFVGGAWGLPVALAILLAACGYDGRRERLSFHLGLAGLAAIAIKILVFPYPMPRTYEPAIIALAIPLATLAAGVRARRRAALAA